jgi:hypothetical protein
MGAYRIPEMHVGLFYFGGALQTTVAHPGFQWQVPFVTKLVTVPLSFQTLIVNNLPCGTKGGVIVSFDRIETVHRMDPSHVLDTVRLYGANYAKTWITDSLPALVNEMCSTMDLAELYILKFDTLDEKLMNSLRRYISVHVPGLEIITIRLTKPTVPESIREKYMVVTETKSRVPVLLSKQKTEIKQLETAQKQAIIRARKALDVATINMQQKVEKAHTRVQIEKIQADIFSQRAVQKVDSSLYQTLKEAKSNDRKLTESFLNLQRSTTMLQNTELIFGDAIPSAIFDDENLGGALIGSGRGLPAPP